MLLCKEYNSRDDCDYVNNRANSWINLKLMSITVPLNSKDFVLILEDQYTQPKALYFPHVIEIGCMVGSVLPMVLVLQDMTL